MKIAIFSDTHFGHKADSLVFQDYFKQFYDQVFFPELEKRGIRTVLFLGDLFDRRKYINFNILYRTRKEVLERLNQYETHLLIGNHDTPFRDDNKINSIRELCGHYKNFYIYEEPQEVFIGGLPILFIPWLNPSNMEIGLKKIAESKANVLMGHLEIAGFHMAAGQVCDHGIDGGIFSKYKAVFSGHFHHASQSGPIRYLGAPYEMSFADLNDPKGFYIFDTETLEMEFVQNPIRMFFKLVYDDRQEESKELYRSMDFTEYTGKFVRVIVTYKTDPVLYEQWLDRLLNVDPELQLSEQYTLDIDESVDREVAEEMKLFADVDPSEHQTLAVINKYVDGMGMEIDRTRLKTQIREIYVEATAGVVNVQ